MSERIGTILSEQHGLTDSVSKRITEWQALPLERQLAPILDGYETLELRELMDREHQLRSMFRSAVDEMNRERADAIRLASKPIVQRVRLLQDRREFARVCPVDWLVDANEGDALKSVHAPTLHKLLSDPLLSNRSLLLCGPTKAGKSTALGLMVRRMIASGFIRERERQDLPRPHICWTYARALAQAARQYPLGAGECPDVAEARSSAVLVLDDLGLERDHAEIVDVVHERYERGRITWTTTGLTKEQLAERYGESFVRRLVEGRSQSGMVVNCFPKVGG